MNYLFLPNRCIPRILFTSCGINFVFEKVEFQLGPSHPLKICFLLCTTLYYISNLIVDFCWRLLFLSHLLALTRKYLILTLKCECSQHTGNCSPIVLALLSLFIDFYSIFVAFWFTSYYTSRGFFFLLLFALFFFSLFLCLCVFVLA